MNVLDYFLTHYSTRGLKRPDDATDLMSMPLDSNCGDECKKAIDDSLKLRAHVRAAWGDESGAEDDLAAIVVRAMIVYICG